MSGDSWTQLGRKAKQKVAAADPQVGKPRSKKNTRLWCRGVVGREHDYQWREDTTFATWDARRNIVSSIESCTKCHKQRGRLLGCRRGTYGPAF